MGKLLHLDLTKQYTKKLLNKELIKKVPKRVGTFFYDHLYEIRSAYFKLVAKNLSKSAPLKSLATMVPLGSIKKLAGILWIPN